MITLEKLEELLSSAESGQKLKLPAGLQAEIFAYREHPKVGKDGKVLEGKFYYLYQLVQKGRVFVPASEKKKKAVHFQTKESCVKHAAKKLLGLSE